MRLPVKTAALAALALSLAACADGGVLEPMLDRVAPLFDLSETLPEVYISEIHYDNASTDTGEAIEVNGPAGKDLTGWTIVLYNGSNGTEYNTRTLSGSIPATCGDRGVVVATYPTNGIQNGAPDGVALVDASGAVVEFLSYEGVFAATEGPAAGMTSVEVGDGVDQNGRTTDDSLQRSAAGGWSLASPRSFGACNDGGDPPPPPPPARNDIVINELMGGPEAAESSSWGEWFEVHNRSAVAVNLKGWTIASGGQASHVIESDVVVAPGGYAVLGRGDDVDRNGGVELDYNYYSGGATIWLDDADFLELTDPDGAFADRVSWTRMPLGATLGLRDPAVDNANADSDAWSVATRPFGAGDLGTPDAVNDDLAATRPEPGVAVRLRVTTDGREIPAGYVRSLFYTVVDAYGDRVFLPTAPVVAWSSSSTAVATVDARGYVFGVAPGTATLTGTTQGLSGSVAMTVLPADAPTTARYEDHLAFGRPTDATPADEILIDKEQFSLSYNSVRGGPNWVSWNLNGTQFGDADRCDCFSPDIELPAGVYRVQDTDYRNSGYNRGHMVQSESRTTTLQENAATFLMTNILPQAGSNNSGPWGKFENYLNDLARDEGREIYVVAGGEYSAHPETLKGEGHVAIPEFTWKVAVIVDGGEGAGDVHDAADVRVLAVRMPNDTIGARDIGGKDWDEFTTTVDEIEARVGYDVLSGLPDQIEWIVETGAAGAQDLPTLELMRILVAGVDEVVGKSNSLQAKLATATKHLEKGHYPPVRGVLGAFTNEVEAMVRSGRLAAADGEALTTLAGWILQRID